MYLLIQYAQRIALADRTNLHPTMYLLIQLCPSVSWIFLCHLHPTMYLLILTLQRQDIQVSVIYIPLCIY